MAVAAISLLKRWPGRHMAQCQLASERTLKRSSGWNDVKRWNGSKSAFVA